MATDKAKSSMVNRGAEAADAAPSAVVDENGAPVDMSAALARRTPYVMAKEDGERMQQLAKLLGVDDITQLEVIAGGKLPFWPAIPGEAVAGVIEGRREVPTRYKTPANPDGKVGLYTIRLVAPATGTTKQALADGEVYELRPGDRISVLERSVLKELRLRVGQKICILCVGKTKGADFAYWDYRIVGVPLSAERIQANAQLQMAEVQTKELGR